MLGERRMVIKAMVDRVVRERRVWLVERAAESKETKEVERTGPASPSPAAFTGSQEW